MPEVLLDTGALFAGLDVSDPNHQRARAFMTGAVVTYVVIDTIFSEAMTLIKARLGARLAVAAGEAVLAGPPFRLQRLSEQQAALAWRYFARYTDKAWSYVDCSLLAVARASGLSQVFSFDHHFDQMTALGVKRVP